MAIKRWLAVAALFAYAIVNGEMGDHLGACGPFFRPLIFADPVYPGDREAYARGSLGVVQPHYARKFLVLAYRRLSGVVPAGVDDTPPTLLTKSPYDGSAATGWHEAAAKVGIAPSLSTSLTSRFRQIGEYDHYLACNDDAFLNATATLAQRVRQFGPQTAAVRQWTEAQEAVFANCQGAEPITLPAPAPAGADPIVVADRAYQTAAANFYGERFDIAETLFREIARDATSPWQSKGRYLAARALVRRALLKAESPALRSTWLSKAEAELSGILADPSLSSMHAPARSMRDWVNTHLDPATRLREAAVQLATSRSPAAQDYVDFTTLADQLINPTTKFDYSTVDSAVAGGDDLTDWVVAMQGEGPQAEARAIAQWRAKRSLPWLVAALWRVTPDSPAAAQVLDAASNISPDSPAHATLVFLRVRLMTAQGNSEGARALLASVPDTPDSAFPAGAINLIRAQRFRRAATFDEMLRAAPRLPVGAGNVFEWGDAKKAAPPAPSFDVDAAIMFTEALPLARLVDASASDRLPARLRTRVAIAAWTRAVELRDDVSGIAVARVLKRLAPPIASDLDAYINAPDATARHYSAVLTLLRWPGLRNYVPLTEEYQPDQMPEPRPTIGADAKELNWWCGFSPFKYRSAGPYDKPREQPVTSLPDLPNSPRPAPSFLSTKERVDQASQWQRLAALGSGPSYLSREAAAWAKARPQDRQVAEALALAVRAGHYGCGDEHTTNASRQAFALLHKLYPGSPWAKRTPYWYEAR